MKVTIEFDTVEKTLSVSKGGEDVPNLSSISFYTYNDGVWTMNMEESSYSKEEGMNTRVCTYAHEKYPAIASLLGFDKK